LFARRTARATNVTPEGGNVEASRRRFAARPFAALHSRATLIRAP